MVFFVVFFFVCFFFFSFFISNGWRFKQATHPILGILVLKFGDMIDMDMKFYKRVSKGLR